MGNGSDANLDPITYQWNIVSMPAASQLTLPVATIQNIEFVPDVEGAYVFSLVVNDGLADGAPDNIMVTVTSLQDAVFTRVSALVDLVSAIDPGDFKKDEKQAEMLKKVNKILDLVAAGKYRAALEKLQHKVLRKTDGCFIKSAPEKNDWIKDCDAQSQLYPAINEIIALLERLPEPEHSDRGHAEKEDKG